MARKNCAHILLTFATIFAVQGAMAANNNSTTKPSIADYTRPLNFEPNRGQTDKQVDFLAHGTGYGLFLSHGDVVMVFQRDGTSVRMRPVGTNSSASAEPIEQQISESNYFIGNVPERWHTNIPNYAKVRYRNVYPGVDLIYYGNQRHLEYDFVLAPGADAHSILLDFQGASKAELDRAGDLVMHTSAGDLHWHKPVAYQEINGSRKRIACSYVRKGSRLAFELNAYDLTKPLTIDPVLEYSTYLGGSGQDSGNSIAVGAHGNVYVTGGTHSTNFPITKGAFQSSENGFTLGWTNAFVSKFDRSGELVYSTYLGGSGQDCSSGQPNCGGNDVGNAIAVDADENAYVTGVTFSIDFPTKNPLQAGLLGVGGNAFVTKLDRDGDELVYSTYLGGSGQHICPVGGCFGSIGDVGFGIAVDHERKAYITGSTASFDFPITKNAFQTALNTVSCQMNSNSCSNAFVTELKADGKSLVYSTYLGGSGNVFYGDQGYSIAVDAHLNFYVTGNTESPDFPITQNAFQKELRDVVTCVPCGNAFVTKFEAGGKLAYSTFLGGSGGDQGYGIALDSHGHAYIVGRTASSDFPTKNAFQKKLKGLVNAFATKFDTDGDSLVYSTYLGGSDNCCDQGNGIAVDTIGDAYVTGTANSTDFPTKNAFQEKLKGASDAFVTKIDKDGDSLVYSSYLGGSSFDSGLGIAVGEKGNAYVTGFTFSNDFRTKHAFQPLFGGAIDAFVTKISAH